MQGDVLDVQTTPPPARMLHGIAPLNEIADPRLFGDQHLREGMIGTERTFRPFDHLAAAIALCVVERARFVEVGIKCDTDYTKQSAKNVLDLVKVRLDFTLDPDDLRQMIRPATGLVFGHLLIGLMKALNQPPDQIVDLQHALGELEIDHLDTINLRLRQRGPFEKVVRLSGETREYRRVG